MTIYRTWNTSGTSVATNPSSAYDNNITTFAELNTTSLEKTHTFINTTSLTGMSTITLYVSRQYAIVADDTSGIVLIQYSWDGTNFSNLSILSGDYSKGDATYETFSIPVTSDQNLNTLRIRFYSKSNSHFDVATHKILWGAATHEIYEMYVDVSTGPAYTVNAITGSTSIPPGRAANYSTTVTNDPTGNSCNWTIVSGGGSLGTVTNDATSSRVAFTPPWTAGTTVLKATCTHDSTKSAQITVSYAGLTVNAISGSTSVQAGASAQYSTTVTNDATDNSCSWTIVSGGGSLGTVTNNGTSSRVTWTAPTASGGTAVLKATSTHDATKSAQITVTVPAVSVSITSGPSGLSNIARASSSQDYGATVTNHSSGVSWTASSGSINSSTGLWAVPATPGKYTVTATHLVDTTKTSTVNVYVDYAFPSTSSSGASCVEISSILSTPTNAYDGSAATKADLEVFWEGAGNGSGTGYAIFTGFPSVASLSSIQLTLDYMGAGGYTIAQYTLNGTDWVLIDGGVYVTHHTTPQVVTITPGFTFNLNQLQVRFLGSASMEYEWNPNTKQEEPVKTYTNVTIYEVSVKILARAYTANTSFTPPSTSTPKPMYAPTQFSVVTGVYALGTPPIVYPADGSGRIAYYNGSTLS